jgi:hypothetical protein
VCVCVCISYLSSVARQSNCHRFHAAQYRPWVWHLPRVTMDLSSRWLCHSKELSPWFLLSCFCVKALASLSYISLGRMVMIYNVTYMCVYIYIHRHTHKCVGENVNYKYCMVAGDQGETWRLVKIFKKKTLWEKEGDFMNWIMGNSIKNRHNSRARFFLFVLVISPESIQDTH